MEKHLEGLAEAWANVLRKPVVSEKKTNPFNILSDGTKLSGLVTDDENQPPRECHNCIHYKHDKCHHPVVMIDPEVIGEPGEPKPVGERWCCNYFKSPGRVLLYAVRHGEDEDDDAIGGWDDPDIDSKGVWDAKEAAEFLKDRGIKEIYCSDLDRTKQTAAIIAKALGITVINYDFRLRTWDKGYLNGAPKSDENEEVLNYYKDNPHLIIPKGESRQMFEDRCDEVFNFYLEEARNEGIKLIVTHNSDIKELQKLCGDTDESVDSVLPGGIAEVSEKKDKLICNVVLKDRPQEKS